MSETISQTELVHALSLERFARYLGWANGDRPRAIALYTLNTRISESLYVPLQTLDVALRNRIHSVMTTAHHEAWFRDERLLLGDRQAEQLAKATRDVAGSRKEHTAGRVVAGLTFGFWTSMLGVTLWQKTLHRIAARADGKGLRRKDFSGPLAPIRTLRNRIAHHEPIIDWDLRKHHEKMLQLTEWLSPAAAAWCREIDHFDGVYPTERIALANSVQGENPLDEGARG